MGNEKFLNTRVILKHDTLENWNKNTSIVLKEGEVALARVDTNKQDPISGELIKVPTYLMKVGDGGKKFSELNWFAAPAADVHDWAKAATKPTYAASEITGISDYISQYVETEMGISVDTDTQYQIVKVDELNYKLQSKGKGDTAWADVEGSTIVIPESTKVEASTTNGNIKVDGEEVTVYTHPNKHAISEVDGLQDALDDKVDDTTFTTYTEVRQLTDTQVNDAVAGAKTHAETKISEFNTSTVAPIAERVKAIEDAPYASQEYADQAEADAVAAAKTETDTQVNALANGAVAGNTSAIEAINNETTGILAQAKTYVDNEDKFEIDMVTVNAHGGVAAGEDLNGLTTHEILKKILYPYVQAVLGNATATPNGGTYEKGTTKTITQVSISVTKKSELITSVALYNGSTLIEEKTGDAVKNGGTFTFTNLSVEVPTNGNQLTVKVTDAKGTVQEKKTTAMTFVYPYYMGACAAGTVVDEAVIESLTKKIESKGNKSHSFDLTDSNIVFAYPKAHGVLKSIIDPNGYETISGYNRSEVSVTGLDGSAQTYYVYVSKDAATSTGFTVNFKY